MKRIGGFLLLLLASGAAFASTAWIHRIPDFTQTHVRGAKAGNGQQYCGPVAVSNSFMWLAGQEEGQLELIEKLASAGYMNTSLENGTGTTGILRGADRLARELFGGYASLEYQGWRKHPETYSSGVEVPQLRWIREGISGRSAVWLNIGWYRFDPSKDEYHRFGGHWVTLVGSEGNTLILHDPSPRAGESFANEHVRFRRLNTGRLVGRKAGLPRSARGHLLLGEGMHMKARADAALLDGAVVLRLDP